MLGVYDVRDLAFENSELINKKAFYGRDNAKIDAIWRRSAPTTSSTTGRRRRRLSRPCAKRKVARIGSFAGHIVHDKQIFEVLSHARKPSAAHRRGKRVRRAVPFPRF